MQIKLDENLGACCVARAQPTFSNHSDAGGDVGGQGSDEHTRLPVLLPRTGLPFVTCLPFGADCASLV